MARAGSDILPSWNQETILEKRQDKNATNPANGRELTIILLGVILGFAVFIVVALSFIVYCSRRGRRLAKDPQGKVSLNRLRKLEAAAPTRKLGEWWPTVKQSLGISETVENNFVCVVCFDQVERTQDIHELRCQHVFHKECLEKWYLLNHYTCPLCHRVFVDEREKHHSTPNIITTWV